MNKKLYGDGKIGLLLTLICLIISIVFAYIFFNVFGEHADFFSALKASNSIFAFIWDYLIVFGYFVICIMAFVSGFLALVLFFVSLVLFARALCEIEEEQEKITKKA